MSSIWEYKIVPVWDSDESDLNKLDSEGWELIHIETKPFFGSQQPKICYFKRPKRIINGLHERWKMKSQSRLGQLILEHLVKHGLHQKDFAIKVGLSQPAVSRIIKGTSPQVPTLVRLLRELGISVEDL